VHEARRACKRLRGALRLFRPALGEAYEVENTRYRDAARVLGRSRDRHVLALAFDGLQRGQRRDRALRAAILRPQPRRAPSRASAARMALKTVDDFRARLLDGLVHVDDLTLPTSVRTVIEPGFAATYRACRRELKQSRSRPTDSNLHEWRKVVKYHACHLLLIRGLSRKSVKGRAKSCDALGETLGDDHDLALLASAIRPLRRNRSLKASAVRVLDLVVARRERLQRRAFSLGDDLFEHPTEAFVRSWLRPRIRRPAR
jgi:CHAD domain-containing protein